MHRILGAAGGDATGETRKGRIRWVLGCSPTTSVRLAVHVPGVHNDGLPRDANSLRPKGGVLRTSGVAGGLWPQGATPPGGPRRGRPWIAAKRRRSTPPGRPPHCPL